MTAGPLGQGIAAAVGFALAERLKNARFGDEAVNYNTYVLASDGDLMEGVSHEAIELAGCLRLNKLIVLYDDNGITIDGKTDLAVRSDTRARFEAAGWYVQSIDGHRHDSVYAAIQAAQASLKPSIIICKTIIGKGAPKKAGAAEAHGSPLGPEELQATKDAVGWKGGPFEVPEHILEGWREAATRGKNARQAWLKRVNLAGKSDLIEAFDKTELNPDLQNALTALKKSFITEKPEIATRVASQKVLEVINAVQSNLIGGSADLTPSNNTKTEDMAVISADCYAGRYIHYGVREHAMAACMNGLALSKGFIPYGGTFLAFSDYSRPALRLAALMKLRVIHVMTHDSIGLGEDGPTHQPVEHLSALRAIPNLYVFRPADAVETAECWQIALKLEKSPSVLALTRQSTPALRDEDGQGENLCLRGAYILQEAVSEHCVTLLASGSEVAIAREAQKQLEAENIGVRLVSVPCIDLFERQSREIRDEIIPRSVLTVAVEAGCSQAWGAYITDPDCFVGMHSFGASAPYKDLYAEFEITPEKIIEIVKNKRR